MYGYLGISIGGGLIPSQGKIDPDSSWTHDGLVYCVGLYKGSASNTDVNAFIVTKSKRT